MRILPLLLALALTTGCGDDIQFRDPPRKDAAPGATPGAVKNIETHGDVSGGEDPFADPEERGAPARKDAQGAARTMFTGRVELAPGFSPPARYTVYVTAYVEGTRMPVCVKRFARPSFPMAFTLTTADIMGGTPPPGSKLKLGAILSEGGGVTPAPGTVFVKALTKEVYAPGATGAVITISR